MGHQSKIIESPTAMTIVLPALRVLGKPSTAAEIASIIGRKRDDISGWLSWLARHGLVMKQSVVIKHQGRPVVRYSITADAKDIIVIACPCCGHSIIISPRDGAVTVEECK